MAPDWWCKVGDAGLVRLALRRGPAGALLLFSATYCSPKNNRRAVAQDLTAFFCHVSRGADQRFSAGNAGGKGAGALACAIRGNE
jgi:hypothetical protein